MEKKGWDVKKNYHLDTAWVATFSNGNGGRVLGVNSEMDALPGIGHGCGHNLIAIAGVAVALAVKAALIEYGIPGKIILLGTPGMYSLHLLWSGCDPKL
jgi:metal-dependent amidase/aminoacylase/carboxypeptidase family protein